MRTKFARPLAALIVGLLLVGAPLATWWAVSPYLALKGLADASRERDEQRFEAYVDLAALRENALAREEERIRRDDDRSDTVRLNDRAIASMLMGPLINRVFSRTTTFDLVHRKDQAYGRDVSYILVRDGPNYFGVRFLSPLPLVLKFRREGFGWKIVDVWVDGDARPVTT